MREGVPILVLFVLVSGLMPTVTGMHAPEDGGLTLVFTDRAHPDVTEALVMVAEEHEPPEHNIDMDDRCRMWAAEEATDVRFEVEPHTVEAQLHLSKDGSPGWLNVTIAIGQVTEGEFEAAGEGSFTEAPGWEPGVRTYEVELEETQVFAPADQEVDRGDAPAAEVCTVVQDVSEGGASLGVGINSGIEYAEDAPEAYPTPEPPTLLLTVVGLSMMAAAARRVMGQCGGLTSARPAAEDLEDRRPPIRVQGSRFEAKGLAVPFDEGRHEDGDAGPGEDEDTGGGGEVGGPEELDGSEKRRRQDQDQGEPQEQPHPSDQGSPWEPGPRSGLGVDPPHDQDEEKERDPEGQQEEEPREADVAGDGDPDGGDGQETRPSEEKPPGGRRVEAGHPGPGPTRDDADGDGGKTEGRRRQDPGP